MDDARMAQQTIDTTTLQPNGKQGEPIRTAFEKANLNFTELYEGLGTVEEESLKAAQNLADLDDTAEARDNLELGTAAQGDLQKLSTDYYGDTEPNPTWPGMTWAHPAAGVEKRRNEANSGWIVERALFFDYRLRQARFITNGSFTVPGPSGTMTTLYISGCAGAGGGGGGGSSGTSSRVGGGGGGGGCGDWRLRAPQTIAAGTVIPITIGGGGTGGAAGTTLNGGTGGAGGATVIGSLYTLAGGNGGTGGGSDVIGGAGAGGTSSASGGNGSDGASSSYFGIGGVGGFSQFGTGGYGGGGRGGVGVNGSIGGGYGAGGGGGGGSITATSSNGGAGGAGTSGIVLIEW